MDNQVRENLLEYLKTQKLMSVATYGKEPWIATVYYVVDDDLNLYFLSSINSQHAQDILKNEKVACNIFDSHQKVTDKKVGVQVSGICRVLEDQAKIEWVLQQWHRANPGSKCADLRKIKEGKTDTRVFCVTPRHIKFFNEELYPESKVVEVRME